MIIWSYSILKCNSTIFKGSNVSVNCIFALRVYLTPYILWYETELCGHTSASLASHLWNEKVACSLLIQTIWKIIYFLFQTCVVGILDLLSAAVVALVLMWSYFTLLCNSTIFGCMWILVLCLDLIWFSIILVWNRTVWTHCSFFDLTFL